MDDIRLVKISKYLSKHLRHDPGGLGLTLAPGGWVPVTELLAALAVRRFALSRAELEEVVANNNKQRFSFDESGTLIRANQGHSVDIDLQLTPTQPPDILYHGTGHQTAEIIRREGLHKMRRHHGNRTSRRRTAWSPNHLHHKHPRHDSRRLSLLLLRKRRLAHGECTAGVSEFARKLKEHSARW